MDDYEEMLMTKAAWHYYFEGITNDSIISYLKERCLRILVDDNDYL